MLVCPVAKRTKTSPKHCGQNHADAPGEPETSQPHVNPADSNVMKEWKERSTQCFLARRRRMGRSDMLPDSSSGNSGRSRRKR